MMEYLRNDGLPLTTVFKFYLRWVEGVLWRDRYICVQHGLLPSFYG